MVLLVGCAGVRHRLCGRFPGEKSLWMGFKHFTSTEILLIYFYVLILTCLMLNTEAFRSPNDMFWQRRKFFPICQIEALENALRLAKSLTFRWGDAFWQHGTPLSPALLPREQQPLSRFTTFETRLIPRSLNFGTANSRQQKPLVVTDYFVLSRDMGHFWRSDLRRGE